MKKMTFIFLFVALLSGIAAAQKTKPWSEWTKDEVDKMLNKSAWGHTVVNTDTSGKFDDLGQSRVIGSSAEAIAYNYTIRFFSAKPMREAFARKITLDNPKIQPVQLQNFVNGDYSDSIVVAVTFDSPDRRYLGIIQTAFHNATTELLQGKAYLELKDGKHVLIDEYSPPSKDGTGAKFVFPRNVDGKPFASGDKEVLRFVAIMGDGVQMSWRFKMSDMMYDGKLEY